MKHITLLFLFFCVAGGVVVMPVAAGQQDPSGHTPTRKILEFSLSRLKESVQKTVQKNNRLAFENDVLRQSIAELTKERDRLAAQRAPGSGTKPPPVRPVSPNIKKREQRVRELIAHFEPNIARLEKDVKALELKTGEGDPAAERRELLAKRRDLKKAVSRTEKKLRILEKANKKPRKIIRVLQKRQNKLTRKWEALERRRR